jgi:D-3-phosphoglycerate dehydrogenase
MVMVYDRMPETDWSYDAERAYLAARGIDLETPDARARTQRIAEADVLLVHEEPLTRDAIGAADRCIGVVAYSVGMNQIDLAAAAERGIEVRNSPTYCSDEVSDHAVALLLALERGLGELQIEAEAGNWDTFRMVRRLRRLRGQTAGVVGTGRIGRLVASKCRALGFSTIGYDPHVSVLDPGLPLVGLDELLDRSDAVVLCAPLNADTEGMISTAALSRMRRGAFLVNVSRGRLIDEDALVAALDSGHLAGAALDVRTVEPPPTPDPLASRANVILTPHIAGVAVESFEDLHLEAAQTAAALLHLRGRVSAGEGG